VAQFDMDYQQFQIKKMQLAAMGQPQKPQPKEKA